MDQRYKQAASEGAVQEPACKQFVKSTEQEVKTRLKIIRRTESLTLVVKLPEAEAHNTAQQASQVSSKPCCPPCQGPFFGCKTLAGPNSTQEDSYIVIPSFLSVSTNPDKALCNSSCDFDEKLHLFAIFDGHGGRIVSDFCASYLHLFLSEELSSVPSGSVTREPSQALQEALCRSFIRADQEVLRAQPKAGEGSTGLVVLLGQNHVWTAHCGDTRAVLCRAGEPIRLTEDHRPERDDEVLRVREAGGAIVCNRGTERVMGMLLATRSIGDHDLRCYGVIPDPELHCYNRCPDDEFMVLASDGLWDVVQCHEACNLVAKCFDKGRQKNLSRRATCRVASDALMRMAQAKGSPDDITIIVVDMRPEQLAEQQPCAAAVSIAAAATSVQDTCRIADAATAPPAACAAVAVAAAGSGLSALTAAVREVSLGQSTAPSHCSIPAPCEQHQQPPTADSCSPSFAFDSVPASPFTACTTPSSPFDFCTSPFTSSPFSASPFSASASFNGTAALVTSSAPFGNGGAFYGSGAFGGAAAAHKSLPQPCLCQMARQYTQQPLQAAGSETAEAAPTDSPAAAPAAGSAAAEVTAASGSKAAADRSGSAPGPMCLPRLQLPRHSRHRSCEALDAAGLWLTPAVAGT